MSNRKPRGYWTLERCMEDARLFSKRSHWMRQSSGAYDKALKQGWIEACCKHMDTAERKLWDLDGCKLEASKYASMNEWGRLSPNSLRAAYRYDWVSACSLHMPKQQKPNGFWTRESCMEDAAIYKTKAEWRLHGGGYEAARVLGFLGECVAHMVDGYTASDSDVVYIWRDAGTDLHKVGVTSERLGEQRIDICKRHNNMEPRIVFMLKVDDARAVESELLKLGTDPELDSSIDGYTEFRRLTDAQLGQAVSIAYEAAVAA